MSIERDKGSEPEELPPVEPWVSNQHIIEVPGLLPKFKRWIDNGRERIFVSTNFEQLDSIADTEERKHIGESFEKFREAARDIKWLDGVHRAVLKGRRKAFFIPTAGAFIVVVGGVAIEAKRGWREIHELVNLINPQKEED